MNRLSTYIKLSRLKIKKYNYYKICLILKYHKKPKNQNKTNNKF